MTETLTNREPRPVADARPGPVLRLARSGFRARLRNLRVGHVAVVDGGERLGFGEPESELSATIFVLDPRFYRALARGHLGAAEAYMDGYWRCDDLVTLVRIMARNRDVKGAVPKGPSRLAALPQKAVHALRRNTRPGSRRNIAAHYDLGNDFFALFLDPSMTYSCGIFEREDASMEEASIAKYERVCRKLRLRPEDHVLEIGTGWGGFACHAAREYGCRVTTTTISAEQFALARRRVAEAGLEDRVELLLCDYRDLEGRYDKLVSIEMIEAVGYRHLEGFFRVVSERLGPRGVMLLQAITTREQDFESSKASVDFVKRYIFPGGQLVSLGTICDAIATSGDLRMVHLEDITPHYAETLRHWRERMSQNLDAMRALGLPERFLSMWEFYLGYCEGSFRERAIGAVQVLFEKSLARHAPVLGEIPAAPGRGHA